MGQENIPENQTPSKVEQLFKKIYALSTEPDIFRIILHADAAMEGYTAFVNFYHGLDGGEEAVSARGMTPEGALQELYSCVAARFTACPVCGRYEHRSI